MEILHDLDDPLDGSLGDLQLELTGLFDELLGDSPDTLIATGFILKGLESPQAV